MRDVTVEVPDGTINVWHRRPGADRETIVLVHGLSGTSRWWTRVLDHLAPDLGVIALDVRGRGGSVNAPPPFDLTTLADDITRSLNHFEVERAIIAGYSMGAWVAAIFGQRHADRAERLVLVDGGLPIPFDPDTDPDDVIEAVVGPSLSRLRMEFSAEDEFFDYWKAHPALQRHWDEGMKQALAYELSTVDGGFEVMANPEAITVAARQITVDPETNAAAATVEMPAHLLVVEKGTADEDGGMIPLATAKEAATTNSNLTMEYLPGLNHYTLLLGAGAGAVASAINPA